MSSPTSPLHQQAARLTSSRSMVNPASESLKSVDSWRVCTVCKLCRDCSGNFRVGKVITAWEQWQQQRRGRRREHVQRCRQRECGWKAISAILAIEAETTHTLEGSFKKRIIDAPDEDRVVKNTSSVMFTVIKWNKSQRCEEVVFTMQTARRLQAERYTLRAVYHLYKITRRRHHFHPEAKSKNMTKEETADLDGLKSCAAKNDPYNLRAAKVGFRASAELSCPQFFWSNCKEQQPVVIGGTAILSLKEQSGAPMHLHTILREANQKRTHTHARTNLSLSPSCTHTHTEHDFLTLSLWQSSTSTGGWKKKPHSYLLKI